MLYRHVFDKIFTEFHGILRVFVNFVGFRRFPWISQLRNHAKYQKPCHVKHVGCLSFTILNFLENKKAIIKILVYTSVWYYSDKRDPFYNNYMYS